MQNSYDALNAEGKVIGATKSDSYVSFDGVDDYIDLGLENYDFVNQLTISVKVKLNQVVSNISQCLLGNWEDAGGGIFSFNNEFQYEFYDANSSTYKTLSSGVLNDITSNTYTLSLTANQNSIKAYVNGVLVQTLSGNFASKISPVSFALGTNPEISSKDNVHFAKANIYQAVIYNRTLTDEEIKNNMSDDIKVTNREGLLRFADFTGKKNYQDNEVIPEDVIESYFVWIPKYRYKLWDLGNYDSLTNVNTTKVHTIDILFGDYNTSDDKIKECTTPMKSGESGHCKVGDYMTHPSFLSIPSTGFWVGKFETGYKGAQGATATVSNSYDVSKVEIKPNAFSWQNIDLAYAYLNAYNYRRSLDSHVMKNTEWGAVTYLSHSSYAKASNVRRNNNTNQITGYAANEEATCGYIGHSDSCNAYCSDDTCTSPYNTSTGYLASTTGNIYGVYDMSGGAWESVMAVMTSEEGNFVSGKDVTHNSSLNGLLSCRTCTNNTLTSVENAITPPLIPYYDTYSYVLNNSYQFKNRILGDATGELGPFESYGGVNNGLSSWYKNGVAFVNSENPWFTRGGDYENGTLSGIFSFLRIDGSGGNRRSFRILLTPLK